MRYHPAHKLLLIAIVLAVFAIPFYAERYQLSRASSNAYLAGAVLKSGTIDSSQATTAGNNDTRLSGWADSVGSSFIGLNAK